MPDRDARYRITDLNHLSRKSLLGKADLSLGEFAKLTVESAVNCSTEDWWARPGLEWSMIDGVQVWTSVHLFGEAEDSFFGSLRDNRRLQLRLKYSF